MNKAREIYVQGIPDSVSEAKAAICRSRIIGAISQLMDATDLAEIKILAGTDHEHNAKKSNPKSQQILGKNRQDDEPTVEERAKQYISRDPLYKFDFLVVPDKVKQELMLAMSLLEFEPKVFDEWGLRAIEPFPRTALNFYGPPGTGKTLAAHALAHNLGRLIITASYAQIESKFHGDGPKNVEALFHAAERDQAVLFIDEADSLLSRRLTNVTQGSEQAINSMRSQLLVSLEKFKGIVIFATNLVQNYDKAFDTRVRNIHFPMPDEKVRYSIWTKHLGDGKTPPLAPNIDLMGLAGIEDICGRDIKNAVIDAALSAARVGQSAIEHADIVAAIERIKASRIERKEVNSSNGVPADEETSQIILKALKEQESTSPSSA